MKIAVIGSSNTDMVIKTAQFPSPGQTVLGGTFLMNPGGKGANQAVAAARLGGEVAFIAQLGNDIFGQQALAQFGEEGIRTDFVFTDPHQPSGVALITVDAHGENTIVVAPGANSTLSPGHISRAADTIRNSAVCLLQLEIPVETVLEAAKIAASASQKVILNPAPAAELPAELYPLLFLITPNETEAELLTGIRIEGIEGAKQAAKALLAKGVKQVIITLGAEGALLANATGEWPIPSQRVEAVDTTAAGDVFNGALAVGIAEGKPLSEAVAFANRAAAISVTRLGAQASAPYRREI